MIVAANWKMNIGVRRGRDFLQDFKKLLQNDEEKGSFIFFPPAPLSFLFAEGNWHWGGQNVFSQREGAYTGENSPEVFKELSARFCLLGHSERRHAFGETDLEVEKKFHLLKKLNLTPVLCVGEQEREQRDSVLKEQLSWLKAEDLKGDGIPFIVAYEPVWAIGSGKTPTAGEINSIHKGIKSRFPGKNIPVLYGGSVTEERAKIFWKEEFVDGFLVGGASLRAGELYSIFQAGKIAGRFPGDLSGGLS